jgi:hypothetical protein
MRAKLSVLVILLACVMPFGLMADFSEVYGSLVEQRTFIIKSESLRTITREPFILLKSSRMLSTRDIQRACNKFSHAQKLELVYTPDDGKCVPMARYKIQHPKFSLNSFLSDGQNQSRLSDLMSASEVVLIKPIPLGVAYQCACPTGNRSPVVQVASGSPQSTESATPITAIVFVATDADGQQLTRSYSFIFDSINTSGLPAGLGDSCSSSAGTLTCTINGLAPSQSGVYLIKMTASDGSASGNATATLSVQAPPPADGIFHDSFESLP